MNTDIHRLLDEAFAGVAMTPDAQDLKEEVRANLVSRVDELEGSGVAPPDAARRAVAELGDVRALLADTQYAADRPGRIDHAGLVERHRVRPRPDYVLRTVLFSVAAVGLLVLTILCATGVIPVVLGPTLAFLGFGSTAVGMLVGDALSQETTTTHPLPQTRAGGFALATFLGVYGLGYGALIALGTLPVWTIVFAAVGVVASVVLFAFLGATQTNRKKAWVRRLSSEGPPNRFEREPETAARFGIYTVVIWLITFAVIVALVFTVGWWWAPLAFAGGFAAMMLVLARMLFAPQKR